jgi:hemolysin III
MVTLDATAVEEAAVVDDEVRPSWRGQIHRYAAIAFVPAFVVLVFLADSATSRFAMAVYGAGVCTMLGVSAVYHSGRLGPVWRARLKRLDHSTILFAVTGSYTGICSLALNGAPEVTMLVFVWSAAVIGTAIRMLWLHAPRWVTAAVYVVVGWSALIEISPLMRSLAAGDTALMMAGGGLYSLGAGVYATKRPNWSPRHFGFHELFHALVVAAAILHYVLVVRLLAGR